MAARKVVKFVRNATWLCMEIKAAIESHSNTVHRPDPERIFQLLDHAERIDKSMMGWYLNDFGWEELTTKNVVEFGRVLQDLETIHYYRTLFAYLNWYRYHLARVFMYDVMVKALKVLPNTHELESDISNRASHYVSICRNEITHFIRSVPYSLGDINHDGRPQKLTSPEGLPAINVAGAHRTMLILFLLRDNPIIDAQQSKEINSLLRRMARELHLGWVMRQSQ